ncbi:phage head closure protein [Advenella sp. WQ 585]|uniref:Phage head closure protein n=1 Tax=Advenella mandrilli TaxID=2800330 RepID=A0ABS1ECG0_9BURK|nr:phage head closure protein [Advenella mandrilli]MBK1780563.1 phage head closure protein [Advenella mandrilli]
MRAGRLNARIEIQEEVITDDGMGGGSKNWRTIYSCWAEWRHGSMNERLQAMQLQSSIMHRVFIYCHHKVTAKNSILYNGNRYQIRAVVDVNNRHERLELLVEEGVAA